MLNRVCLLLLLGASCLCPAAHAQDARSIDSLVVLLTSPEWPVVDEAQQALVSRRAEAIPAVVALLGSPDRVTLRNTMDLIYPGAERFYGHGFIVPYELDWIAVRAGWVLEELAFQDFGFREGALTEDALIGALADGQRDRPVREVSDLPPESETRPRTADRAASRAREWYAALDSWTCLGALNDALVRGAEDRQADALEWLRHGRTRCGGLDVDSYRRDIEPVVRRLASEGSERIRVQAELLLQDERMYWLSIKPQEHAR